MSTLTSSLWILIGPAGQQLQTHCRALQIRRRNVCLGEGSRLALSRSEKFAKAAIQENFLANAAKIFPSQFIFILYAI